MTGVKIVNRGQVDLFACLGLCGSKQADVGECRLDHHGEIVPFIPRHDLSFYPLKNIYTVQC